MSSGVEVRGSRWVSGIWRRFGRCWWSLVHDCYGKRPRRSAAATLAGTLRLLEADIEVRGSRW